MSYKLEFEKYVISETCTLMQALEKLNANDKLTLIVLNDNGEVVGTITDGDIRRGILKGISLESPISTFMHGNFIFLKNGQPDLALIDSIRKNNIRLLPVLNNERKLVKLFDLTRQKSLLPVEAVLMAGGKGERLRPLTEKTPKPLLKLGNKAIIEYNINNLSKFGIENVYISVKYLADQIIDYLGNGDKYGLNIQYIREDEPLGTLGAVTLVDNYESDTVLVMNSDLFTNLNLEEFYKHYLEVGADMAIASFPYVVSVPYGVLNIDNSSVTSVAEKPTYTYHASAGMYLIKKEYFNLIPKNTFYNATDLMDLLFSMQKKITYFPIVGYWIDIGKPDDYKKAQEYVKYLE
ncbi:MAG: nucleotidyltransferase family protein [Sporocytophaga sp.]|uniref:nucleotidyltransferase family protein n=1 Tax=Sporocytophaga sp. TaxID=2231183 RepID=UPI001B1B2D3A|nr:nucleotidyltransferase family protein [Sporocytophaga sp.]MBO9700875.1 nucleotidyltransferase family protein [Sporocytophaga sp.]